MTASDSPTRTNRTPWWRRTWVVSSATFILGATIASAASGGSTPQSAASAPRKTVTVTDTETATETATEDAAPTQPEGITDGTYVVGVDIKAGTYHSTGGNGCYWARLSSDNETDIIDNHLGDGPTTVTIKRGDHAFETNGCDPWVRR
jgi:hypothetical protein